MGDDNDDDFDLAGFVVGAVEREKMLPKHEKMKAGDILIGLASSGPHSNGYSLIRKIVDLSNLKWNDESPFMPGKTLGESLITPTRIYVNSILSLIKDDMLLGLSHITGGGITENTPRMLPKNLSFDIDISSFPTMSNLGTGPNMTMVSGTVAKYITDVP